MMMPFLLARTRAHPKKNTKKNECIWQADANRKHIRVDCRLESTVVAVDIRKQNIQQFGEFKMHNELNVFGNALRPRTHTQRVFLNFFFHGCAVCARQCVCVCLCVCIARCRSDGLMRHVCEF